MNFSVTKYGIPLNPDLYTWDERTKTFSTDENFLVLDFRGVMHKVTFTTGSYCTFTTGPFCTFTTGNNCNFDTGSFCNFDTGSHCTFTTGSHCTFNTGSYCIFKIGSDCIFKTKNNCMIVRHDIYEVIKLKKGFNHIKLNKFFLPGYTEVIPEVNKELNDFYFTEEDFKIK